MDILFLSLIVLVITRVNPACFAYHRYVHYVRALRLLFNVSFVFERNLFVYFAFIVRFVT